ncbi:MAG: TIR domain-containing protein [Planctomycetaceae bacterium]|nr:TIR domain-containing protein [Planctomycetaceae bacterium]
MANDITNPPRVFISYSWTNDPHIEWVADLGERLMNDGIDVVLDQWSLKDGQDLNAFMEQMVTDPSIKRVLIICDAQYAAKADSRKGGVGTESQIISQEVYERVDQEKFVPLIRERDDRGEPWRPVFLKSRKYIDFSNGDVEAEAYDQLLRNIFDRPVRRKPSLGKPPSHLFDETATAMSCAQKAKRFVDVVSTDKGNPSAAFEDFADALMENLEELRLIYTHDQDATWCQTLSENIERARPIRNAFVDVVKTGSKHVCDSWFVDSLLSLLERILPFQNRPQHRGPSFEISEDNYKFLLYEFFLYTVAAYTKARRYVDSRTLLDHQYVTLEFLRESRTRSYSFAQFNETPSSLQGNCAERGTSRHISVMGDLLHDRADRKSIRFSDLLQADIICCLSASRAPSHDHWSPRALLYANRVGTLELFARATNDPGFQPLSKLLDYATPSEMLEHVCSEKMWSIWKRSDLWRFADPDEMFNLSELFRIWGRPKNA